MFSETLHLSCLLAREREEGGTGGVMGVAGGGGVWGGVVSDVVSSRTLTSCQPHRSNRTFKIPCNPFKTRVA